jgi:hypothetical protein
MLWFRLMVLLVAVVAASAAAKADAEPIKIECWEGSYLTGFHGRAGHWIDTMSITCARWNPERSRLDQPVRTTPGLVGQSGGGEPIEDQCPRGSAVAGGYSYDYVRSDEGEVLHHINFNCRPVGGEGEVETHRFGSNSSEEIVFRPASRRQCADGELATGIDARHGLFIFEWHLICKPGPKAVLVTKPVGPAAHRDTGVTTRKGGLVVVGDAAPPPATPPPPTLKMTKTKNDVDVLKTPDGEKYGGDGDFLAAGQAFPVLVEQPGWCKLKLDTVAFVPGGEGWVSSSHLENCGE